MKRFIITLLLGSLFGTVLIFADAFNWSRIQEMFHFESFHMYGLIGSAIAVGALTTRFMKKKRVKSISNVKIRTSRKELRPFGNIIGGLVFGAGWAMTGACTAPIFILIGFNWQIGGLAIAGGVIGTLLYGLLIRKLPV